MRERTKFKLRGQEGLCDEVTFCQDLQEEKLLGHSVGTASQVEGPPRAKTRSGTEHRGGQ